MKAPLDWTHETTEIPERGLKRDRAATDAERVALAEALDILRCDGLDVQYEIENIGSGAFRLSGDVKAKVVQACVVSLEPVASRIEEAFVAEYRRDHRDAGTEDEREILSTVDVEPLEDGGIDVGRIIFETVSASLDPYPRKAGAEFAWSDRKGEEAVSRTNPFAVLKNLKRDD